jgi:hypothetical protein
VAVFSAAVCAPERKHRVDHGLDAGLEEENREKKRKSAVRDIGHAYLGGMFEKRRDHDFLFLMRNKNYRLYYTTTWKKVRMILERFLT